MTTPKIVTKTVKVQPAVEHRHKKTWKVPGHWSHTKTGKKIWIKGHTMHTHEKSYKEKEKKYKREEIRFGGHFDEVADKIAKGYEKKGYSKKEAEEIGRKTAGDIYRQKIAKAYKKR